MSNMDICVPAFSTRNASFYESCASSTFALAVECNVRYFLLHDIILFAPECCLQVPILVTKHMRASYTYVDDDRAVVTRPAAMREVEVLRALRSGDALYFFQWSGISQDSTVAHGVDDMMHLGWR
jgi:hypothetical protein